MMGGLLACSTPPQGAPGGAPALQNIQYAEQQCSTVGVIACRTVALLSSDSVPTCSVSIARDGRRTEICGSVPIGAKTIEPPPADPKAYPVHLTWSDNSDNETAFIIERCDQVGSAPKGGKQAASCTGVWRSVATVAANTTSYVDKSAALNKTYMYRVKAINNKGSSDYTQEAVITTPAS
jgi:hypothetical protein